jgi:hypothetical protein
VRHGPYRIAHGATELGDLDSRRAHGRAAKNASRITTDVGHLRALTDITTEESRSLLVAGRPRALLGRAPPPAPRGSRALLPLELDARGVAELEARSPLGEDADRQAERAREQAAVERAVRDDERRLARRRGLLFSV